MHKQLQNGISLGDGGAKMLYARITVYLIWIGLSRVRECFPGEMTFRLQPTH